MYLYETEEQKAMRYSVRKLSQQQIPAYQDKKYYGTLPRELFAAFAQLGLAGLNISEEYGGINADALSCSVLMEEIAAVDLGPAIFISVHSLVSGLIQNFGNDEQKKRLLSKLSSGEFLAAFALTEPMAGSDASSLQTVAKKTDAGYLLSGEKCYITSAGWADLYLVFARTDTSKQGKDGISAFIVPSDAKGLSISSPDHKMGCELSPIASLNFDNTFVSDNNLLGELNKGYPIALHGLAGGRINISACANGLSRTAIEVAVKYLQEREQFGDKLINSQGLQFMLADMKMKLEAARLLTQKAASLNDHDSRTNRLYPSMAKCFATDSAMEITTDAVQLLGGAGYLKDYGVEKLMRDAKMLQIVEGTNQIQRVLICRELART